MHAVRSDGFSGVERHVATLAAAQCRVGHAVIVIGGDESMMHSALADTSVRTIQGRTVTEVARNLRRIRRADIVHAHMTAGELAASVAATSPIVVTRHFARARGATPVGRLSGVVIRRRVGAQIAISRYVADRIDGEATVVYPGVEPVATTSVDRRPVVLVVQRLQPEKSTDVALRAFAAGAPSGWTLQVVGRGAELPALEALAEELGISGRTDFLGFRDDVPELMRAASALIAPCAVEGLGLSVLEAMAHGLPVLASYAGAHPETVGLADDAQLFAPGSVEDAGAMLARLCTDAAFRDGYGEQLAQVQRADFTPEAQAAGTEAVYRAVLG
ncbi:glycosyltransferase family 4 protein [Ornithinimicrobium kibberense]|uniref:Glycosyltransferase family 4 protein n=1 Tax=Ornithinimicrobium kibberense TaxID=282060 RepID=A0ABV5V1Q7_9MICO